MNPLRIDSPVLNAQPSNFKAPRHNTFQKASQTVAKRLTHPVFRGKSPSTGRRIGGKQVKKR
jgi:hypothetical protein